MIYEVINTHDALPIGPFLAGIALSPDDKKTVEGVVAEVQKLEGLKLDFANRQGATDILAKAEAELGKNPSAETVAALENAAMRSTVFDQVRTRIERTLNAARDKEIASLGTIAAKVIDAIAANLEKAEAEHNKTVAKSPFGAEVSNESLSLRLKRTRDELGITRGKVIRDLAGLDFLCRVGLAADPFELAEVAALDDLDGIDD